MKVVHQDTTPVIMLGHGSSGTSILCSLLRDELKVAFGTECQFVGEYYHRLQRYGDLNDDRNLRRLIDDILSERYFRDA